METHVEENPACGRGARARHPDRVRQGAEGDRHFARLDGQPVLRRPLEGCRVRGEEDQPEREDHDGRVRLRSRQAEHADRQFHRRRRRPDLAQPGRSERDRARDQACAGGRHHRRLRRHLREGQQRDGRDEQRPGRHHLLRVPDPEDGRQGQRDHRQRAAGLVGDRARAGMQGGDRQASQREAAVVGPGREGLARRRPFGDAVAADALPDRGRRVRDQRPDRDRRAARGAPASPRQFPDHRGGRRAGCRAGAQGPEREAVRRLGEPGPVPDGATRGAAGREAAAGTEARQGA